MEDPLDTSILDPLRRNGALVRGLVSISASWSCELMCRTRNCPAETCSLTKNAHSNLLVQHSSTEAFAEALYSASVDERDTDF
nr:hypothetical protein [Tanacetum cinerariifolium]